MHASLGVMGVWAALTQRGLGSQQNAAERGRVRADMSSYSRSSLLKTWAAVTASMFAGASVMHHILKPDMVRICVVSWYNVREGRGKEKDDITNHCIMRFLSFSPPLPFSPSFPLSHSHTTHPLSHHPPTLIHHPPPLPLLPYPHSRNQQSIPDYTADDDDTPPPTPTPTPTPTQS